MAVGQNKWYHFGVGAPPILVYFSRNWDVHWGLTGTLTHGHILPPPSPPPCHRLKVRREAPSLLLTSSIVSEYPKGPGPCNAPSRALNNNPFGGPQNSRDPWGRPPLLEYTNEDRTAQWLIQQTRKLGLSPAASRKNEP